MGQDLLHVCTFIGINDILNISVKSINVKYRFCRYHHVPWLGATLATGRRSHLHAECHDAFAELGFAQDAHQFGAAELITLVRAKKDAVHAPKSVDFVEALPLTAVGKPDKKALRAPYWSGAGRAVV